MRTKSDVLRELREVDSKLKRPDDPGVRGPQLSPIALIRERTILRQEIKFFNRKTATGEDSDAIKKHWARQIKEAKKKIAIQNEKDAKLLKKAEQSVKKDLKKDKGFIKKAAEKLSIKELKALIDRKKVGKSGQSSS